MKPPRFLYAAPRTLEEALDLLAAHGGDGKVLAGGQSLMPLLNMRLVAPAVIIDLNRIETLDYIEREDGVVRIGAMTRQRAAEHAPLVAEQVPLLAEGLRYVGHPQIRNRGTIGGSLAHADPAAELPAVAAALEATCVLASRRGGRTLNVQEFFVSYLTTALDPDELLTEIRFPASVPGTGWAFAEVSRRHGDFALAGVAAVVEADAAARCRSARLAFTGVGGTPIRIPEAEAALANRALDESTLNDLRRIVADRLDPQSDIHASAFYRRRVAGVLAVRATRRAAARAGIIQNGGHIRGSAPSGERDA